MAFSQSHLPSLSGNKYHAHTQQRDKETDKTKQKNKKKEESTCAGHKDTGKAKGREEYIERKPHKTWVAYSSKTDGSAGDSQYPTRVTVYSETRRRHAARSRT